MNKRILAVLLAGLVSANAWPADAGAGSAASQPTQGKRPLVVGQPYSATHTMTVRRQQPGGGESTHETVTKVHRDSAGRERRDILDSDGNPTHSFITGTDGSVTVLDHRNRTVPSGIRHVSVRTGGKPAPASATAPAPVAPVPAPAPRRAGAKPVVEHLGERDIEGVTATGEIRRQRIGDGPDSLEMTTETWTAKELGLALYVRNTDAKGESVIAFSDIDRGEPDPALFAAPDDYQRRP